MESCWFRAPSGSRFSHCFIYKTLWETALAEVTLFLRNLVILTEIFELNSRPQTAEVSKSRIWKHTTCATRLFFSSIIFSQLRRPIEFKFSQVCYYYAYYVEIHQVRRLVFDNNYQRCPVPLNTLFFCFCLKVLRLTGWPWISSGPTSTWITFCVSRYDGTDRRILIDDDVLNPRGIAVHPFEG